jgi:hypothetical protein
MTQHTDQPASHADPPATPFPTGPQSSGLGPDPSERHRHTGPHPSGPQAPSPERDRLAGVFDRAHAAALKGNGFWLEIDTIEEFAAFMAMIGGAVAPAAVGDFAAAKLKRGPQQPNGFYLAFASLHDFTAFVGIMRGKILDVADLADVTTQLAAARARLQASQDRADGTPSSPASGPPHPLSSRPSVNPQPPSFGEVLNMDPQAIIDGAVAEAAADVTVMGGAQTVIDGIGAAIDAAVAKALANGATQAQLQPLADVQATLSTQREALAASIAARTTADSEVPAQHAHLKAASKPPKHAR